MGLICKRTDNYVICFTDEHFKKAGLDYEVVDTRIKEAVAICYNLEQAELIISSLETAETLPERL